MKLLGKRTSLYGLFNGKPDENCKEFDDSKLFEEKMHKSILLKTIKIYFIEKDKLLGLESLFVNFITGEKKTSGYHGGEIVSKDIQIQEITMEYNEYIKSFDIEFDKDFEKIIYIHILTNRGKELKLVFPSIFSIFIFWISPISRYFRVCSSDMIMSRVIASTYIISNNCQT